MKVVHWLEFSLSSNQKQPTAITGWNFKISIEFFYTLVVYFGSLKLGRTMNDAQEPQRVKLWRLSENQRVVRHCSASPGARWKHQWQKSFHCARPAPSPLQKHCDPPWLQRSSWLLAKQLLAMRTFSLSEILSGPWARLSYLLENCHRLCDLWQIRGTIIFAGGGGGVCVTLTTGAATVWSRASDPVL